MSEQAGRVWRCGSYELALERTLVMGVLNVTPDSFSDGGEHDDPASAVQWAERMIAEGAAIIDVGGESSRPGAHSVAAAEELSRVRPVIKRLSGNGVPISVDTRHADVAAACVEIGASIINDISGFRDAAMVDVAARSGAGVVVMHMLGEPETMQDEPVYEDVVAEVGGYLLAQAAMLEDAGVHRDRIAIDPGIGFGKNLEHNLTLLGALPELASHGYPIVVGVSRKRFLGDLTGEPEPRRRVGASVAAALEAARLRADIVRVHDVAETVQALEVTRALTRRA